MAKNSEQFILTEGDIEYGTFASPESLTSNDDPESIFTKIDDVGYTRQGTINVGLNDERVEYLSKTPQQIIRKDLIRRNFTLQFTANQFNKDVYGVFFRFNVEIGAYVLAWIGSDEPTETRYGFLYKTKKVDGSSFSVAMWAGSFVTEDKSLAWSGTDYVDVPVMIQAFVHPGFSTLQEDKNYGMFYEPYVSGS